MSSKLCSHQYEQGVFSTRQRVQRGMERTGYHPQNMQTVIIFHFRSVSPPSPKFKVYHPAACLSIRCARPPPQISLPDPQLCISSPEIFVSVKHSSRKIQLPTISHPWFPPECQTFSTSKAAMPPRWLTLRSCYASSEDYLRAELARVGGNTVDNERELLYCRAKYDRDHGESVKGNDMILDVTEAPRLSANGMI